jgi:hypothetical protein
LIATRGYASTEAGDTFAGAAALAERLGRSDHHVAVLYGLRAYRLVRSEHRLALPLAERMQQIGDERNEVATILYGRFLRGITHHYLGEFVAARDLFEQCQGLQEPAHRQAHFALAPQDGYCARLRD